VDTNSAHIARALRDIGVNLFYLTTVGDNLGRIEAAIRAALERSDLVITTGGLGPTVDDMTRQAVAKALDRDLEFREDLFDQIRARFDQIGARMSENNRVQAFIPAGAIPVRNPVGTAPCFIVEAEQGTLISLPGVPREMKHLLAEAVIPYLRERTGGKGIIKARILRTAGIGESNVDDKIADLETWENPTVGLAAHVGQTDIRITARADSEFEADALIAQAETVIRERLGGYIYGTGEDSLEETFIDLLHAQGLRLAVSYNGPEALAITRRFDAADVIIAQVNETELADLLARLAWPEEGESLSYAKLAEAEARRVMGESGADVAITYITHEGGTGLAAMMGDTVRTRQYEFGGIDAPNWAQTWAISMAWHLVRREKVES
jgi:competence/damage-inducible protein CinA-like protein